MIEKMNENRFYLGSICPRNFTDWLQSSCKLYDLMIMVNELYTNYDLDDPDARTSIFYELDQKTFLDIFQWPMICEHQFHLGDSGIGVIEVHKIFKDCHVEIHKTLSLSGNMIENEVYSADQGNWEIKIFDERTFYLIIPT